MRIVLFLIFATAAFGQRFGLQLFFEREADMMWVDNEANKLKALVAELAPHIDLEVQVLLATRVYRTRFAIAGRQYNVPNQQPTIKGYTALLVTNEMTGAQGLAGPNQGVLCKPLMADKTKRGGNSAEITIHEWLHTLYGKSINGRKIPHPHTAAEHGFKRSGVDSCGQDLWTEWYAWCLRP